MNPELESQLFFPFSKPWFAELGVLIPMVMFTGGKDYLVDGLRAASHMRHGEPNYVENRNFWHYHVENYTHVDVTWAQNIPEVVAEPLLRHIRDNEALISDGKEDIQVESTTDTPNNGIYLRKERHTEVDELYRTRLRNSVYVPDEDEELARFERRKLRLDRRRLGLIHSNRSGRSGKSGKSGKSSRYLDLTNPPALPKTDSFYSEKMSLDPLQPAYHPPTQQPITRAAPPVAGQRLPLQNGAVAGAVAPPVAPPVAVMNAAAS